MKTNARAYEIDYSNAASRACARGRSPIRVVDTALPAIAKAAGEERAHSFYSLREEDIVDFDIWDPIGQAEAVGGADGMRKPELWNGPRNGEAEPQFTIGRLQEELSKRSLQIAELCSVQQQQADALQIARDIIEDLDGTVRSLRELSTQRETEVAVANQALSHSVGEKQALRERLEETERQLADLRQKHLDLNAAYEEREAAVVSARERASSLKFELCDKAAEIVKLTVELEGRKKRSHNNDHEREARLGRWHRLTSWLRWARAQRSPAGCPCGQLYADAGDQG